jgi:thiol-disulfide isomerase/thioredoxin
MAARIGTKAPNLRVSKWVQGIPTNIDKEKDNVVLVEVFQVNCPGCFLYGIPEAINIHKKYGRDCVTVMGLATAFEDYDKNTLENLELLLKTGEVIGETRNVLGQYGNLDGNKLSYKIPFRVAMDSLKKESADLSQSRVMDFIEAQFPDFRTYSEKYKADFIERVKLYLKSKQYTAETFEEYALRGTPSSILIDKKGILRHVGFGQNGFLENTIQTLLKE